MKKLLLLLSAGVIVSSAIAQQNGQSLVHNPVNLKAPVKEVENSVLPSKKALQGSKKTTVNNPFWYSYGDVLFQSSVSKLYYNVVYQDSNLTYMGTSGLNNVFTHGMGMSFDPTDSTFYYNSSAGQIQDYDYVNQDWIVTNNNSYTVDSVRFLSKYYRTQNFVDTLVLQFAKVPTVGTNPTGLFDLTFTVSQEKFVSAWYDSSTNYLSSLIPASAVMTMKIPLDATSFADTTPNGWSNMTLNGIALTTPMILAPGEKLLAYAHFRSGNAYPLNTPVTSANYMRMYSYDLPGQDVTPVQNKNSYHAGLVATSQIKYATVDTLDFTQQGRSILIPNIAYATDGLMTDMAFRVTCATCPPLSVKDAVNPISNLKAYPNPSSNEVNISFTLTESTKASVTISNTIGQVLRSKVLGKVTAGKVVFSTSDLSSGIYFYSVEANGKKSTGRFVVTH